MALQQFASAVDIVDDTIMDRFANLLQVYLLHELPFNFYEILYEEHVVVRSKQVTGLRTLRVMGGKRFSTAVVERGRNNHTAYCYFKNHPMWITATNQGVLLGAEKYFDSWEKPNVPIERMPDYKSGNKYRIKTSIIQPIRDKDRACGVINIESKDHLVPNDFAREELTLVAEAVSVMVIRHQAQRHSREGTVEAIEQLPTLATGKRWTVTQLPKIFVASPDRCDDDVMKAVREVVASIDGYEMIVWNDKRHDGTGESRRDLIRGLCESRAAVCYVSGLALPEGDTKTGKDTDTKSGASKFIDNPNVLFEAGIADGLHCIWEDLILVVVREPQKMCREEMPFDLQGLTPLVVSRDASGDLEVKKFKKELEHHFNWS